MSRAAVLRERWALNLPLKMGFKLMLFFVLLCSFLTKKKKKKRLEGREHSELSKHKNNTEFLQEKEAKPRRMDYKKLPDTEQTEKWSTDSRWVRTRKS